METLTLHNDSLGLSDDDYEYHHFVVTVIIVKKAAISLVHSVCL